jgi:hypothetical protein
VGGLTAFVAEFGPRVSGAQWAAVALGVVGVVVAGWGALLIRRARRRAPVVSVEQREGLWKIYVDGVHVESQTVRQHAEASAARRCDPHRQARLGDRACGASCGTSV